MDGIYENIEEYNPNKKRVLMILFDDMIFTLSYFAVPKNIRRNSTHYSIMKIPSKEELQQIAFNHKSYINFRNFLNLYKNVLPNHICFSDWYYSCIR